MERYAQMKNSGVGWIQDIPTGWGVRVLFQLADQVKNKNKDLAEKNLLSLSYGKIKRKDINNPEGLLPESFDGYNIIEADDIVLRLTDLQNDHTSLRVGQANERGIITSAYTTLRPSAFVNPRYLYYVLHAYDLIKGFYGMGAGVRQGLNYDEVKTIKIPFPPMEEQHLIAAYLDEQVSPIDSIIEEAQASIEEYKRWKASIIHEAITKGIDDSVPMRDSGIDWIGQMPLTWECRRTKFFGQQTAERSDSNENYIGLENIESGSGRFVASLNKETIVEGTSIKIQKGDVIFGKLRPYLAKSYVADKDCCGSTEFIVIHPLNCIAKYLMYVMLSPKFVDVVNMSTYGAKMPRANWGFIGNIKAPYPPIEIQKEIVNFLDKELEKIDSLIAIKQLLIGDMELYKRSLTYEAVTGKRKVV